MEKIKSAKSLRGNVPQNLFVNDILIDEDGK